MIGKINNSPSFSSKVILNGFGTNNYKNIKMEGYSSTYVEATKKAIKTIKGNKEKDTVTISYDKFRGTMSVGVEMERDGHKYSGGPMYFFPNIGNIERMYERAKKQMALDS